MMLTAFLPMRYWEIMSEMKEAFLISFVTSLSVASLPMIQRTAQKFASKYCENEQESEQKEIIQTTLSISYPLAQIGNFFILGFLLYASFYFFIPLRGIQLFEMPFVTLMSGNRFADIVDRRSQLHGRLAEFSERNRPTSMSRR